MSKYSELNVVVAINRATEILKAAKVPSPVVDARELAEFVLGEKLFLAPLIFTSQQLIQYTKLIEKRAQRIPLQHLLGKMWFRYLQLKSVPGVFIVRPETEIVAEEAISEVKRLQANGLANPLVLDLCTGSGAIALAVATETSNDNVHAVELSDIAFNVAMENNAIYGDVVDLQCGDALCEFAQYAGKVDIVVANPPYVPISQKLSPEVQADPAIALFGGSEDGLDFPRKLINHAAKMLKYGGLLVMEHDDAQGEATCAIAREAGFGVAETKTDLTAKPRYLVARKISESESVSS